MLQDFPLKHPGPQMFCSDARFERRPEISKRQQNSRRPSQTRTVRIEHLRIPDVLFAHQAANLAQRQFEFFRLRSRERE